MIVTVEELRRHVNTDKDDKALEDILQALESSIKRYTNNSFTRVLEENNGQYPPDVKMGVVNLMQWELNSREKVGVQSETISRHSVTYASVSAADFDMGYPKRLMGFLKPYMKARFGQWGGHS
jgi:hypothetical protein